jgi:hypothetical protein
MVQLNVGGTTYHDISCPRGTTCGNTSSPRGLRTAPLRGYHMVQLNVGDHLPRHKLS